MDCRCRGKGRQVSLYPGSHRDSPADNSGSKSRRCNQLQLYMKLRTGTQEEFL